MKIDELKKILRDNGVVGAGGAGFPTYGKLAESADTIILNCAECEPLLKLHRQLMASHAWEIMKGFALVAKTLGAERAIIGIKGVYREALAAVQEHLDEFPLISVHELPNQYPMGDEVVLIYETTGRVVRPGGLPIECGAAVFNVETCFNIYRAVFKQHPVIDKLVTVAGEVEHPVTVRVPVGMKLAEVVAMAGKVTCEDPVYLIGGPMMGGFQPPFNPVTKTTSAVIVLPRDHSLVLKKTSKFSINVARSASSCCQCQTCTDLCPRHALGHPIEPHLFMRSAANRDTSSLAPFVNTYFCCSCGLCELYSCPQGLAPRSMMAQFKGELRKNGVKAPAAVAAEVLSSRDYRKVPEGRLMGRLGLKKYDSPALLDDGLRTAGKVKILLSQHIGAPAAPTVKEGEPVKAGQLIAKAAEGLSVNIHASIDGRVTAVTDKFIEIG